MNFADTQSGREFSVLTSARFLQLQDITINAAAVVGEKRIIVVGCDKITEENVTRIQRFPRGTIVDLETQKLKKFTNGHSSGINSVAVARGLAVTSSDPREPLLRVWDIESDEPRDPVQIEAARDAWWDEYTIAPMAKTGRVSFRVNGRIVVFDLFDPFGRYRYDYPHVLRRSLHGNVFTSRDETTLACGTFKVNDLICWDVETRAATTYPFTPHKADLDRLETFVLPAQFLADGSVLLVRSNVGTPEVPAGVEESKVDPIKRAVMKLRLPGGEVEYLGFGHTIRTNCCVVDPTETWIVTSGSSRPDKPTPENLVSIGELRVYNLKTKKLVYREQANDLQVNWMAFTPNGKRLVATTAQGVVRWWDVAAR